MSRKRKHVEISQDETVINLLKKALLEYRETLYLPKDEDIETYQFKRTSSKEPYDDVQGISGHKIIKRKFYIFPKEDMDPTNFETEVKDTIKNYYLLLNEKHGRQYHFQEQNIICKTPDFEEEDDLIESCGQKYDTDLYEFPTWTIIIWGPTAHNLLEELIQRPNREAPSNTNYQSQKPLCNAAPPLQQIEKNTAENNEQEKEDGRGSIARLLSELHMDESVTNEKETDETSDTEASAEITNSTSSFIDLDPHDSEDGTHLSL